MRAALLALLAGALVRADLSTTEAEEAAITDGPTECVAYGIPLTGNALAANEFPSLDSTLPVASIQNDTDGLKNFQSIQASIPNIPIKTVNGTYDNAKDPDCYWTETNCVTPKLSGLKPDISMAPEPRTLGYGFDDGPACDHNVFYNYLSDKGQKANGHEICVHTWSHGMMTQMTNEQAFAELWYTIKAIKLVTGLTPTCWRPPHGDVDDRIRFIARSLNLDTIMWKYDAFDWANGETVGTTTYTPEVIQALYDKLISDAKSGVLNQNGAIMLTHELNNFTMGLAVTNYPKLLEAFDYVVPVAIAMNKTQPYAETNVTLPSFKDYAAQHPPTSGNTNSSSSTNSTSTTSSDNSTTSDTAKGATGASGSLALLPSLGLALAVMAGVLVCS
ncbi:carbohydrate esterase family 4 protein [Mycena amicta]|nr:carbohydrate esterase family 4 protein [Mycena amicta]